MLDLDLFFDEGAANGLYLRLDSANNMSGAVNLISGAFGTRSIGDVSDPDSYNWFSEDAKHLVLGNIPAYDFIEFFNLIIATFHGIIECTDDLVFGGVCRGSGGGSVVAPLFTSNVAPGSGLYFPATTIMAFSASTVEAFRCTNASGTVTTKMNGPLDMNDKDISKANYKRKTVTKTANYTATINDDVILVDASGGPVTITLYPISGNAERVLIINKIDNSGNIVTVVGNINGRPTKILSVQYSSIEILIDDAETEWSIIG